MEKRILHSIAEKYKVQAELRGWNWDRPPVKPNHYLGLGVSEVAYFSCCPEEAIKMKLGKKEVNDSMLFGLMVHKVFMSVVNEINAMVLKGLRPWLISTILMKRSNAVVRSFTNDRSLQEKLSELYRALTILFVGDVASEMMLNNPYTPKPIMISEYVINGIPLGLSKRLRADAVSEGMVLELKTGKIQKWHRIQLAGYAMALESQIEQPVDYGALLSINVDKLKLEVSGVFIDEGLRSEFLEARNEMGEEILRSGVL